MSSVARTNAHIGPNGRVPAIHSCGAPVTYRMLACLPNTNTSSSYSAIWASARSRRPVRKALASGEISFAIGGIGVVGNRRESVFGNDQDLLTAIAAGAVFPDHRFQHQDHSGWKDEVVVEFLAEIGSDHWRLGRIRSDAVA